MKHYRDCEQSLVSAYIAILTLVAFIFLCGCSGPGYWYKIRIQSISGTTDQQEMLGVITRLVLESLLQHGFECDTDYGHALFYAVCTRNDDSGFGQTTDTFVKILHPDSEGIVEIDISTNQLSYHPFTRSSREYFIHWRDAIIAVVDSLPDITYHDYEID